MAESKPEVHTLQDMNITDASAHDVKTQSVHVEHHEEKGPVQQMRTKSDDLPIWETVKSYKLVTIMAFAASFSASLDGYRR